MNEKTALAFGGGALLGGAIGTALATKKEEVVQVTLPPELAAVVSDLGAAVTQLRGTLERFDAAVSRLETVASALSQQAITQSTITALPMDPRTLSKIVQGFGVPGETEFPVYRASWLAPANIVTKFVMYMPSGFVGMMVEPFRFIASYYDTRITIDFTVDDIKKVTPVPFVLSGPGEISLGEWYVVQDHVTVFVSNGTNTDTTITTEVQSALLQRSFYEEWFRPVLKASWDALNNLAELMGGKKR